MKTKFVATRKDGLCMRLNAILDAAVLAKALDGAFEFYWDESKTREIDQQTTDSATRVFTESFLEAHRVTDPALAATASPILSLTDEIGRGEIEQNPTQPATFLVNNPLNISKVFPFLATKLAPNSYRDAFEEIGFCDDVTAAIKAARQVEAPENFAVVHIRGGDVLHGTNSNMGSYLSKAPSVPEIETFIAKLRRNFPAVWLVGQEPDIQRTLVKAQAGVFAFCVTHDAPKLTDVGHVIFDAVFMSRATRIVGGFSGVTHLSRRLGNASVYNMSNNPSAIRIEQLLTDPMSLPKYSDISVNSKAHAYLKFVVAEKASAWTPDHLTLTRLAKKYRPDSKFVAFIEICILAHLGAQAEAQPLALDWLTEPIAEDADPDVSYAFLTGGASHFPIEQAAVLPKTECAASSPLGCLTDMVRSFLPPRKPLKLSGKEGETLWASSLPPIDPALRRTLEMRHILR